MILNGGQFMEDLIPISRLASFYRGRRPSYRDYSLLEIPKSEIRNPKLL